MGFEKDERELGAIFISEGKPGTVHEGTEFFGGKVFPIPPDGVRVDLIPFEGVSRKTGLPFKMVRVMRVE